MSYSVPDWASEYFERGYEQRWGVLTLTETIRHDAGGLWSRLQLQAGARVADIGCGHGRYALAFAERNADAVGVDFSHMLLQQARRLGVESGLPAHWVRGDMRVLPLRQESCAAVVVMDAFGFFESEDENDRVLAEAARILAPGGFLAMKVVNGEPVLAEFRPSERQERDGVVVAISRTLTVEPARMVERVSITGSRGDGQYERRQRLYRADELLESVTRAGFTGLDVFSDACGAPFDAATSRSMWVIGRWVPAV